MATACAAWIYEDNLPAHDIPVLCQEHAIIIISANFNGARAVGLLPIPEEKMLLWVEHDQTEANFKKWKLFILLTQQFIIVKRVWGLVTPGLKCNFETIHFFPLYIVRWRYVYCKLLYPWLNSHAHPHTHTLPSSSPSGLSYETDFTLEARLNIKLVAITIWRAVRFPLNGLRGLTEDKSVLVPYDFL